MDSESIPVEDVETSKETSQPDGAGQKAEISEDHKDSVESEQEVINEPEQPKEPVGEEPTETEVIENQPQQPVKEESTETDVVEEQPVVDDVVQEEEQLPVDSGGADISDQPIQTDENVTENDHAAVPESGVGGSSESVVSGVPEEPEPIVQYVGHDFVSYIVETAENSFEVFQSFTYGEMVISVLLTLILLTMWLTWFWRVVR